jgi:hypothetical protein
MTNDPFQALNPPRDSTRLKLLAVVCAVGVTAILLTSYVYIRKRYALQTLASNAPTLVADSGPKGPPVAHILIDDPLLNKGRTVIGGTVKNISQRELTGLSVALELRRRKDGATEQKSVALDPAQLQPQQEGSYSLILPAQDYGSIRLMGLKADPQSTLVAYTSASGKRRPPERLQPKAVVGKPSSHKGEFLNSPDNPTRVP